MESEIVGSLLGATPVSNADVCIKAPEGFERHLAGDTQIALGVEVRGASVGHDLTASFRRSR